MPKLKNLRLDLKLTFISAFVFSIPILVLFFFQMKGINASIRFSTLEVYGDAYQRPLEALLQGLSDWYIDTQVGADDQDMKAVASKIDQAFDALAKVQEEIGEDLQFTEYGLGLRDRGHLMPDNVRSRWEALKGKAGTASAGEDARKLMDDVRGMI
ncbi:MAG: hypothetical protein PHG65_07710, partial [Kiritimatiellae bacterium]|nr:hypothetical protein [Kiritimatiellia bacterium]